MSKNVIKPFELLLEYERRSLSHALSSTSEDSAVGDWSGIGFKLGDEFMVAEVEDINEVVILPELIKIPGIESWVLGLVNLRSNLIPAIDLKLFLTGTPLKLTKHSRMMVINQPGGQAGLVVDEVFGQRHFQNSSIQEIEAGSDANVFTY
ncbi:MAG: chemotaxis protein CheW, partial [Proteobacteria bacterium]|nr:chemotaxis protein CheW [Pseudomonadota bacterium]